MRETNKKKLKSDLFLWSHCPNQCVTLARLLSAKDTCSAQFNAHIFSMFALHVSHKEVEVAFQW